MRLQMEPEIVAGLVGDWGSVAGTAGFAVEAIGSAVAFAVGQEAGIVGFAAAVLAY